MSNATRCERQPLILCIDDYDAGLRVRKLLLQNWGYMVITAGSGEEGLAMLASLQFGSVDVVMVDYLLPGMDGEQLARIIKTHWPGVRVIMLSGNPRVPTSARSCADAFLIKGAPSDQLRTKLSELLAPSPAMQGTTKLTSISDAWSSRAAPGKRNPRKQFN
jgi:CheY-like chemotaxis protein